MKLEDVYKISSIHYYLRQAPFIKITVSLVTGILLFDSFHPPAFYILLAAVLLLAGMLAVSYKLPTRIKGMVLGSGIHFLLVLTGIFVSAIHHSPTGIYWLGTVYQPGDQVVGTISTEVVEKKSSCQAEMEVKWIIRHQQPIKAAGRVLLYFNKSECPEQLAGVDILLNSPIQFIQNKSNPGGFDFQHYAALKGIYHQALVSRGSFISLGFKHSINSVEILSRIRKNILSVIRQNITGTEEKALAEALLIGYREDLDRSLTQAYSNTGVIHVIAISGLHLGVIYWLLSVAFRPLRGKNTRWLGVVLTLSGLWLFSLLCGASPSVIRSAVMFSFICLGDLTNRKMSIYNSLAASAFFLLCLEPSWLWDIGFQLSYLAVLSMVIFMNPIYQSLELLNPFLDKLWKMLSGTLAAQILTTPICIYYFHQFPLVFPLTNLVAIPLSTVILIGEIALVLFSGWTSAASLTGKMISSLIEIMNQFISYMSHLPFAIWKGLVISVPQLLLCYLIISLITFFFFSGNKKCLVFSLVGLVGMLSLRAYSFRQASHQLELCVFNIRGKQAIAFFSGRQCLVMGSDSLFSGNLRASIIEPALTTRRTGQLYKIKPTAATSRLFRVNRTAIMVSQEQDLSSLDNWPEKLDLLIISHPFKIDIHEILTRTAISQVVIDASVSNRNTNYLIARCRTKGIPVWSVTRQGAFVENLSSLTFAPR